MRNPNLRYASLMDFISANGVGKRSTSRKSVWGGRRPIPPTPPKSRFLRRHLIGSQFGNLESIGGAGGRSAGAAMAPRRPSTPFP